MRDTTLPENPILSRPDFGEGIAQIIDFDNLHQAWRKARRGKRYKSAAATFERHLDEEITLLHLHTLH